ncbi:MAG: nucleotidyl transferase AbiEii/AbiGii toxin family protein [Nitrosotalea sp.]
MILDFIERISSDLKILRKDMIEKDLLLHRILLDLSKDKFFSKNFIFKGGTCLAKHYLGYFRFSEDIDFTWKDQSKFNKKSGKEIGRSLSKVIDDTGKIFEEIAVKRGLDFKCIKSNKNYVELGGSNKICTFKIWYDSVILKKKTFVKVQINFVENMCLNPRKGILRSLMTEKNEELKVLFAEYLEYSATIPFEMYDVKEILSEKIRALLTRKGIKARDFLDIFFISRNLGIKPKEVEKCAIAKINYTLERFEKYKENFKEKKKLLSSGKIFEWGAEKDLLLVDLDDKEFNDFIDEFTKYLKDLVAKI